MANEVRNLAQRSTEAANETTKLIEASISHTNRGVAVNQKVADRILEISRRSQSVQTSLQLMVDKIREVDALITTIAEASDEQNQGINQIADAVTQMDQVTQANALNTEHTAEAAHAMKTQAAELRHSIKILLELIHGEEENA